MHTTPIWPAGAARPPSPVGAGSNQTRSAAPGRRVTDAPTRLFHALFALSFLGAYLTAESERWRALHVTLGYTLAGLLALRLLYGLIGPRQARMVGLLRKLAGLPGWLRATALALRSGQVASIPWRQGQNLAMALAIAVLMLGVVPLTLSGYAVYADWGDALAGLTGGALGMDTLEEMHEFLGNAFLAVVLAHLALIVGLSLLRRQNQALPMLTGRVAGAGPDLAKRNHGWLAALLLAAVLGFVAWQWQQAPQGLVPANAWGGGGTASSHAGRDGDRDRDDD